jgi:hypothetical protein
MDLLDQSAYPDTLIQYLCLIRISKQPQVETTHDCNVDEEVENGMEPLLTQQFRAVVSEKTIKVVDSTHVLNCVLECKEDLAAPTCLPVLSSAAQLG